jgi:hypothetical protein
LSQRAGEPVRSGAESRIGLLRQIESEIARIDGQRERVVTNLTRRVITQVAA